jgi:hypothetical protein
MTFEQTRASLITLANRTDNASLAQRYRMIATAYGVLRKSIGWKADNLRQSIAGLVAEIAQIKRDGVYANPLVKQRRVA